MPRKRHRQRRYTRKERPESYPLPRDTRAVLESDRLQPHNYGLRIDRLLLCDNSSWEPANSSKQRFVPSVNGRRQLAFEAETKGALQACKARWDSVLSALQRQGYGVQTFTLCAASRVIVGLGAESVLETSIRLHRIYGFPIIPGSALKGVTRAYAKLVEGKNEDDPTFAEVFGKSPPEAQAGKVVFFDAIPANPANLTLELDVMNPHYAPYYQGTAPPADYHNPVPVFFLTIGPGSEFLFAVASCEDKLATQAQQWLICALKEMGIGAKTVAGYGLWRESQREARSSSDKEATESASSNTGLEPDRPEMLKELPRKQGERIPAEVVDNRQRPIKVRLLVEGYTDKVIPCTGARNLESFRPGTFIWVTVNQRAKDGTVRQVSLSGLWKSR